MKNYGKRIGRLLSAVLFCGAVLYVAAYLSSLKHDADMKPYTVFRENPSAEVLFTGSSHTFESVIPQLLFDEQGIAASLLPTSAEYPSTTYALLREALRIHKPELIVLDAFSFAAPYTYLDYVNAFASKQVRDQLTEDRKNGVAVRITTPIRMLPEYDWHKYELWFMLRDKISGSRYVSSLVDAHAEYLSLSRENFELSARFRRNQGYYFSDVIFDVASYEQKRNRTMLPSLVGITALPTSNCRKFP